MKNKIKCEWSKPWYKQLFCKHDFKYYKAEENDIMLVSGEYRYLVCSKCGKYKSKVFWEYEGMGFK